MNDLINNFENINTIATERCHPYTQGTALLCAFGVAAIAGTYTYLKLYDPELCSELVHIFK